MMEDGWDQPAFNDSHWPFAIEQKRECCPWRDPKNSWKRLAAEWISPTYEGNLTRSKSFYCRYVVPHGSRIMDGSLDTASVDAPQINLTGFEVGSSKAMILFKISRDATVSCGLIDVRYQLRVPTSLELESVFGKDMNSRTWEWQDVTGNNAAYKHNASALTMLQVETVEDCKDYCELHRRNTPDPADQCRAITFWVVGEDLTTGKNCKLMRDIGPHTLTTKASTNALYSHHSNIETILEHALALPGSVSPGTVYSVYCSVKGIGDGLTSTPAAIEATKLSARTSGCLDCGSRELPVASILGGWAARDALTVVVASSRPGFVYCAARSTTNTTEQAWTNADIKSSGESAMIVIGGGAASITLPGMQPSTLQSLSCYAEDESGFESEASGARDSTRRWHTATDVITMNSMSVTHADSQLRPGTLDITIRAQVIEIGYVWCLCLTSEEVMQIGVPKAPRIEEEGPRLKISDPTEDGAGVFNSLNATKSYEVYCTSEANDFQNETKPNDGFGTPYPLCKVLGTSVGYDRVKVDVDVDRGPSETYCRAFRWQTRPNTERPRPPNGPQVKAGKFKMVMYSGGSMGIEILDLLPGTRYDIYCYSEERLGELPPDVDVPPVEGMNAPAVALTRTYVKTKGPSPEDTGWHCVTGRTCQIGNLAGEGFTESDKIMVRKTPCAGSCRCNGQEDVKHKGAFCSPVSQDILVRAPDPEFTGLAAVDFPDPRGEWCYVNEGDCFDEEPSPTFPELLISYAVCAFKYPVDRKNSGPPGFPPSGMSTFEGLGGDSEVVRLATFHFGSDPLMTPGYPYHLCWCNGTAQSCTTEYDFRLSVGTLHMAGPTKLQIDSNMVCVAGVPCVLRFFDGHALDEGARVVVLPDGPSGCAYIPPPGEEVRVPGFTNDGVSLPSSDGGSTFSWGDTPLLAEGGTYILCYCGVAGGEEECPDMRPFDGEFFLMKAGTLTVLGPRVAEELKLCGVGVDCILTDVEGAGLRGGDRVIVTSNKCGDSVSAPLGWAGENGMPLDEKPLGWLDGGFLRYGPNFTTAFERGMDQDDILDSYGDRWLDWDDDDSGASEVVVLLPDNTTATVTTKKRVKPEPPPRGVYGFPHKGMSAPQPLSAHFAWDAPVLAAPGYYLLCWCGAGQECSKPENYKVKVANLWLIGPWIAPGYSQVFMVVRERACEVNNMVGDLPASSQLFIAADLCGGPAAPGAPRDGFSLASPDGYNFKWGPQGVDTPPGKWNLCWCANVGSCPRSRDYRSFAGVLIVKSPSTYRRFYCTAGYPCLIDNIEGEALSKEDRLMVMTVCGHGTGSPAFTSGGRSLETADDGSWFMLPIPLKSGDYRVCWCAAETLCAHGSDFSTDIGTLEIGGPDSSMFYRVCFQWRPCEIMKFVGGSLSKGDRLRVVKGISDCQGVLPPVEGFPNGGVALPSPSADGSIHTWGSELVTSEPGIYGLCWCGGAKMAGGVCSDDGPFDVPAGSLNLGTYNEWRHKTRPPDPPPRDGDFMYAYLLAIPLPFVCLAAAFAGWKGLMKGNNRDAIPAFKVKTAWNQSGGQIVDARTITPHEKGLMVNQVMAMVGVMKGGAAAAEDLRQPIPSFSGVHKPDGEDLLKLENAAPSGALVSYAKAKQKVRHNPVRKHQAPQQQLAADEENNLAIQDEQVTPTYNLRHVSIVEPEDPELCLPPMPEEMLQVRPQDVRLWRLMDIDQPRDALPAP
eukprot:gnl/TRDRNA2_/TRDRNA2_163267_c0_seq1.p1 gnl/TRDRNA2_/TRDRNA2_163267_c0~~gnl/TRDRNA2_/TRDRNA2_163267_c0_seq1.p1  ORF type:complete len:1739 (+),score=198.28 gnl/TRDRNA2_/TRDRNA2_163267_c0_seq1:112-5217(+)